MKLRSMSPAAQLQNQNSQLLAQIERLKASLMVTEQELCAARTSARRWKCAAKKFYFLQQRKETLAESLRTPLRPSNDKTSHIQRGD